MKPTHCFGPLQYVPSNGHLVYDLGAQVEVQSTATGEKLVFPFAKWVDEKSGLEHVLWPDRDGDGIPDPTADAELVKYKVAVYTSDIR